MKKITTLLALSGLFFITAASAKEIPYNKSGISALGSEVSCSSNVPQQCPVSFKFSPGPFAAGIDYYDTKTQVLELGENSANVLRIQFRQDMAISTVCYALSSMHVTREPVSYCQNKTNSYVLSVTTFYYHPDSEIISDNRSIIVSVASPNTKPEWITYEIAGEEITPSNMY